MKKPLLFKFLLLLCALIVGNSAWAYVTWERVTSVSTLQEGGTFIIGYEATANSGVIIPMANTGSATTSAAGFMYSGSEALSGGSGTIDMSTVTLTSNYEVTIGASSVVDGAIYIKVGDNYLGNTNTQNNCKLFTAEATTTSFTPTVGENDAFTLDIAANTGKATNYRYLKYYSGTPRFAVYSTTPDKIVIYKRVVVGDIPVTSVSLNKTSTTLTVGDTEQLTATITPNDATDSAISWESSNTSVATVNSEGNITAVAFGTARITVTTHNGSFTDYCDVTVVPEAATFDFTSNSVWEFPTSKTVEEITYTNGTYLIKLQGSTGNGYQYNNGYLLLGQSGATLTLPAFPFKVNHIKVYGHSGGSGAVTFNVFVGDDAVSTSATSSKVDHDFAIAAEKQDAGTVYVIKVTNSNNMRITKIKIMGYETVSVGSSEYGTYCSSSILNFGQTDVKAYKAKVDAGKVVLSKIDEVPANTGIILNAEEGSYDVPVASSAAAVTENELIGVTERTLVEWTTGGDGKYNYILQSGVFKIARDGGYLKANRAYLHTSYDVTAAGARDYLDFAFDDDVTAVNEVKTTNNTNVVFDLQGRRITQPTKGLYIVNGKKVIIK